MKKIIERICIYLLGMSVLVGCGSTNIQLQKEAFVVELGTQISTKAETYLSKDTDKDVLEKTSISFEKNKAYTMDQKENVLKPTDGKYLPVGKYKASVMYESKEKELSVEVKDTVAPKFIDFKDTISVSIGAELTLEEQFKAEDLSKVTISIKKDKLDLTKAGSYEIEVTATDQYKNKVSKKATVEVKEKEQTETPSEDNSQPTVPQIPNQEVASGNTGSGNQGTTETPQQPAQPQQPANPNVCVPNGTYGRLGNTGKWFNSKNEADTWASNYIVSQPDPWKYFGWYAWTIIDSCGEERNDLWTVDFY